MNYLKKLSRCCLVLLFSMSLILPVVTFAADGDIESEVTVGFAEKTIKGEPDPPKKIVDPIKKGDGDDKGKIFYKVLPKTGETSSSLVTYIGLALVLFIGALSYKKYKKKGRTIK